MNFLKGDSLYVRIVQTVVYAVVIVLPLFYLPWTSSVVELNKHLFLVVGAGVGLIAWLLGAVVTGKLMMRSTPLDKGVLAMLGATILATVFSPTPLKSVFGLAGSLSSALVSVVALSILYFLAVNTFDDRGRMLRKAFSASLLLALLVGGAQLFGWYVLPGAFTHARMFTTVGAVSALGILAAVALPLFASSAMYGSGWSRVPAGAGMAASILIVTVLNGWAFWLVALVGMFALVAFDSLNVARLTDGHDHPRWFALSRFSIPILVVVLGAFMLLTDVVPSRTDIAAEVGLPYGLSWQVVRGVVGDDLLFGWGPENFSLAFDRFGAGRLADTRFSAARFFDGTAEAFSLVVHGGLVALLAFLLLGWCLVQVVARFVAAISQPVGRSQGTAWIAESSGTLAALVTMTVAWFFAPFNLTLSFVWYVLLALGALQVADGWGSLDIESRPSWSLMASLGFMVGLIGVLVGLYLTSTRYLADARYAAAFSAPSPESVLVGLAGAVGLNDDDDRTYRDASQVALAALRNAATGRAAGRGQEQARRIQDFVTSSVKLAQRAIEIAPEESLNWNNLGLVYQALIGIVDDVEPLAEAAFQRASELRPGDPNFDYRTGVMWLTRADAVRQALGTRSPGYDDALGHAEQAFKRAMGKSPSFGLATYYLGAVYERQGRVSDAILQLERLAPYNANDPTLMFELGLLYIRAGRRGDAQAAMERAVFLAPNYVNARWYLALLLEERGDLEGALAQLAEVRKSNPENQVLLSKIAQLEAGRAARSAKVIDTQPLQ